MRVFFRADDLGAAPGKFRRLVELFAYYDQKLNAALRPDLLGPAKSSLPAGAENFLQIVVQGGTGQPPDLGTLAQTFENFFPCRVGEGEEEGFLMTSAKNAGELPNFDTFLDLHSSSRMTAKDAYARLREQEGAGAGYAGIRLRHELMTEEDFSALEELLHNIYKRSIPTSFFSDLIPGFERYAEGNSGHL